MNEILTKLKEVYEEYRPIVVETAKKAAIVIKEFVTEWIRSILSKQQKGSHLALPDSKKLAIPAIREKRPEDVIEDYQSVEILPNFSPEERFHFSLKNYAKAFLHTEDFSQFSLKLWELSESHERPLLVMVMGEFKTGKSTFINAIIGKEVLKSDVTPATAVVTMISYGENEKLVAHFHDGESKEYEIDLLSQLTAEGDESKQSLRSSIKYVELKLPLPLLTKITLVDTPGLNVDNELHINATRQFMHEADIVLWVFSYGKTASRTELASISELGERLKPIAIVNRIDEIDEEEETLEDVLAEIQKRVKTSVKGVYGVSSYLANQALKEQNQQLLAESGWEQFFRMFDAEIVSQSASLKKQSLESKADALASELSEYVEALRKDLDYLNVKYNDKNFETNLKQTISFLKQGIMKANKLIEDKSYISRDFLEKLILKVEDVNETQLYLLGLQTLNDVVRKLSNSKSIVDSFAMFEQIGKDTESAINKLTIEGENLGRRIDQQNSEVSKWEKEVDEFNNSGFFGGRPVFDWNGTGKQLEQRQKGINDNYQRITNMQSEYRNKISALAGRITRQNKEIYKYIQKQLIKSIEADLTKYENDLNTLHQDYEKNMNLLFKRFEELDFAERLIDFLNKKVMLGIQGDGSLVSIREGVRV